MKTNHKTHDTESLYNRKIHSLTCLVLFCIICILFLLALTLFLLKRGNYFEILRASVNQEPYHYENNASYIQRKTQFEMLPLQDVDIAFVGDSITARFEWQEYFTEPLIANRGIDSDVTEGVYNRLDNIIAESPEQLFLMIGINDIQQSILSEITLNYYALILDQLSKELPDCKIYVQSILPVNHTTGIDNATVASLNAKIRELAESRSLIYIDLYQLMISQNDFPYTVDGVHPTGDGYQIWMDALAPYIE